MAFLQTEMKDFPTFKVSSRVKKKSSFFEIFNF